MKLKLHENIKKFRKGQNLTQEKLAEVLGVTVGAVSKWENGNNTPDILMLTILADFFNVSVDVLLGYDMVSKRADDIVENIQNLVNEYKFEEAETVSRDALIRYPHDFGVIFSSAMIYHVRAMVQQNPEDARKAIKLFEKSLNYISQNKDPEINEYIIRSSIAYSYTIIDKKAALEHFKEINFAGINDTIIALVYLQNGDVSQALNYSSTGIINHLAELIDSSTYMIFALACSNQKKNLESAINLADTILKTVKMFVMDKVGYFSKMEAFYYILKAYLYAGLKDYSEMEKHVVKGKKLAVRFDESSIDGSITNDVAKHMRFYYGEKESYTFVDSIGESAVAGIEAALRQHFIGISGVNEKALKKLINCWEEIK